MKINEINISHTIILTLVHNAANKNNDGQGDNFSFTPSQKKFYMLLKI
jgi:hypothetical protein